MSPRRSHDFRDKIVEELDIMQQQMVQERNVFKARAYSKVISQLKGLNKPVYSFDDLTGVTGIGDRIHAKIAEIFTTGTLAVADKIKRNPKSTLAKELMKIYGVGPVKAKSLMEDTKLNLTSIDDLKKAVSTDGSILNDKQKLGLKYYEDIQLRIPRSEVEKHEHLIENGFKEVDPRFTVTVVGSYRRKAETSGDIDVLVMLPRVVPDAEASQLFNQAISALVTKKYILDVLAIGDKKCMAVSSLPGSNQKARRLDVLLTPPSEYAYALLYFTGSDKFNIQFRKKVLESGYSLSEHGLKRIKEDVPTYIPEMMNEADIFNFFKMQYVPPEQR